MAAYRPPYFKFKSRDAKAHQPVGLKDKSMRPIGGIEVSGRKDMKEIANQHIRLCLRQADKKALPEALAMLDDSKITPNDLSILGDEGLVVVKTDKQGDIVLAEAVVEHRSGRSDLEFPSRRCHNMFSDELLDDENPWGFPGEETIVEDWRNRGIQAESQGEFEPLSYEQAS